MEILNNAKLQYTLACCHAPMQRFKKYYCLVIEHKELISLISNLYILQDPQLYALTWKDYFEYQFISPS